MGTSGAGSRDRPRLQRLLVGYDGSLAAASAALWAVHVVGAARIDVLHLWQPPYDSPALRAQLRETSATAAQLDQALESEGAAQARWVARLGADIVRSGGREATPLTRRTCGGDGYHLAEAAEESGADLLVVGTTGTGRSRGPLGSTSDLLVHVTAVPVLVVPWPLTAARRDAAATGPVLVADDSTTGARHALHAVRRLLPGRTILRAEVVSPGPVPRELQNPQKTDVLPVEAPPLGVERLRLTGHGVHGTATALHRAAEDHGASVLVVGSRGRSALREVLLGSTALALLHQARRPVLVVPAPRG